MSKKWVYSALFLCAAFTNYPVKALEAPENSGVGITSDLYLIRFVDKHEREIQGKLQIILKNSETYDFTIQGGYTAVSYKCEDIFAIYFTPVQRMMYNEYRQESLTCTDNPKIAVIAYTQFTNVTNEVFIMGSNALILNNDISTNFSLLKDSILASNIAESAFYANEIAAISRKSGDFTMEKVMSEYAIRAGMSILTDVDRSDELIQFDPQQGRSVTTEEGIRILSEYQRNNRLNTSRSWDFQTFDYIKRSESPELQWEELLVEQFSPLEQTP